MEIKPTGLPTGLPAADALGKPASSPLADEARGLDSGLDSGLYSGLDVRTDAATTDAAAGARPLERPVDPGETRIGSDPWAESSGSSRLLSNAVPADVQTAGEQIADQPLADAVRGAVSLVFQDGA